MKIIGFENYYPKAKVAMLTNYDLRVVNQPEVETHSVTVSPLARLSDVAETLASQTFCEECARDALSRGVPLDAVALNEALTSARNLILQEHGPL